MMKNLIVEVDTASWKKPRIVPPPLAAANGSRRVHIETALLYTGYVTRPPWSSGMALADMWAWMRYLRCFDGSADLKLRPEWQDIDPHQKTILSDDLGMGFTSQLLIETLGVIDVSNTLSAIKLLPGYLRLPKSKKKGPSKSPDFILTHPKRKYSILECKGSQASYSALVAAISDGIPQKRSVRVLRPRSVINKLVAGLYIPRFSSRKLARLCVSDPEPDHESLSLFEQASPDDVTVAVAQVSLAKQFALMGFSAFANLLVSHPLSEVSRLPDILELDGRPLRIVELDGSSGYIEFEASFPLTPQEIDDPVASRATGVTLTTSAPLDLYRSLVQAVDPRKRMLELAEIASQERWEAVHRVDGVMAKLRSPYGFTFGLAYQVPGLQ